MMKKKSLVFSLLVFLVFQFGWTQNTSIDSLRKALQHFENQKKNTEITQNDTVKAKLLNEIGKALSQNGHPGTENYLSQAVTLSEKLNFLPGISASANSLGTFYSMSNNLVLAQIFFQKSLEADIKRNNKFGILSSYNNLGIIYSRQGNNSQALNQYHKAIEIAAKANDDQSISIISNNIGLIYSSMNKYEEALKYFFKALTIYKKNNSPFNIAFVYLNIGDCEIPLKKYDSGLKYYLEGLKNATISKNYEAIGSLNDAIGRVYFFKKELSTALDYFQIGLKQREAIGDIGGIANSYISIGNAYSELGQHAKAVTYLSKTAAMAKEAGELKTLMHAYDFLAKAHEKGGDYKNAYRNYILFKSINDTLFNAENEKKLTEMQLNYEFSKKQDAQKLAQQKKDAATELEAKKQRNTTYFILLVLALVSIFAFGVYVNLKRNVRQKRIIEQQNSQIQNSLTEKETLLREIHHRVKNNLQIISSLLNIQSETIEDQNVLSSIQEGQSRVQAMSLIHQNLYQSEHINSVDIENYLKELVVYLSEMFHTDTKSIQVTIAAEALEFDIDTAILLGLIVNELVSNAYKYAFESLSEGKITITIKPLGGSEFELQVSNNGNKLADSFDITNSKSLGLKLVSMLSRQLRGKFSFHSEEDSTSFVVSFKDNKTIRPSLL